MPDLALAGWVDEPVRELWWAWIVAIQGEGFDPARPETVLLGLGPLLVDKFTGEAVHSGSNFAWSVRRIERERGYRAWWRFWGARARLVAIAARGARRPRIVITPRRPLPVRARHPAPARRQSRA